MPLIFQENISDNARLYVWRVDEPIEWFLPSLSADDLSSLEGITSASRRIERAVWRYLVRKFVTNDTLLYNSVGAPILKHDGYISVSHSGHYVTVMYSLDSPCGVDIESLNRNFQRVSDRYISDAEKKLDDAQHTYFLAVVWSAKEAMYKVAGLKGLDMIRDIRITDTNLHSGLLKGMIHNAIFDVNIRYVDDYVLTFVK